MNSIRQLNMKWQEVSNIPMNKLDYFYQYNAAKVQENLSV